MNRVEQTNERINKCLKSLKEEGHQDRETSLAIMSQCLIEIANSLAIIADNMEKKQND